MEQLRVKQEQNIGEGRNLSFDVMNILACISVIALHHNSLVHTFVPTVGWVQSLVVECVFYWAVPVFIMLSGANLMNYRDKYSTKVFFKKRIQRTVIPWLTWSFLLLLWKVIGGSIQLGKSAIKTVMEQVLYFKVEPVYFFFGELFACYLAIPVFSLLRKERRILWYVVLLNFIFLSCLPTLGAWVKFSWSLDVPVVGSLFIFALLGYLLSSGELSRKQQIWLYVLGVGAMLFRFVYTYHFSYLHGETDTSLKGYVQFHSVLYSTAIFVMLIHLPWAQFLPTWLKKRIPKIASYSFGIYLVHRVVMYYEMQFFHLGPHHIAWRTLFIFVTYAISMLIVAGLRKVPIIKRIMG